MKLLVLVLLAVGFQAHALVKGMNLTELGNFKYDANPSGVKTDAQIAVDQIANLKATHVVLNPTGRMTNPRGNDVQPNTPAQEKPAERARYLRLIQYIHSRGMTVGIRPIFFVVNPDGSVPYHEAGPDGQMKTWWHGNIEPSHPDEWFESFKSFLDPYILIAKVSKAEEFTIGAELYSMTVGIEDQWKEYPYGFPGRWLDLLRYVRAKLGPNVRIMYDVNFTDDKVTSAGDLSALGGELERWRYRLVDLANPVDPNQKAIWEDLKTFWNELDDIGIDMYRSLGSKKDVYPTDYKALVDKLTVRSTEYASQLDTTLAEIQSVTGLVKHVIFKEAGFRSKDKGFINPFEYENGDGTYNMNHQAAAYAALYNAFWLPRFEWFNGASFWDVSVSPLRNSGNGDTGFSPIAKPKTESVLREIFSFEK